MQDNEEIIVAAWRQSVREIISDLLDLQEPLDDIHKNYVYEFGRHFDTFMAVGTISIEMLGIAMEHMLKVLFELHPGRLIGFYMEYVDRLLGQHEQYILYKYETCRLLDCI